MSRLHIAIAAPLSRLLSLSSFPYSDSNSNSLLKHIGIAIAIAKKWVQNPLVSDVTIANAQWKQSYTFTYNPLKKHRYRCMETGINLVITFKLYRLK